MLGTTIKIEVISFMALYSVKECLVVVPGVEEICNIELGCSLLRFMFRYCLCVYSAYSKAVFSLLYYDTM
jgi:hypothetical protein